jgi:hypothetical protein
LPKIFFAATTWWRCFEWSKFYFQNKAMVDSKFNNVEKNDGFDFRIFGIKMTAVAGTFRKNKNILKVRSKDRVFLRKGCFRLLDL